MRERSEESELRAELEREQPSIPKASAVIEDRAHWVSSRMGTAAAPRAAESNADSAPTEIAESAPDASASDGAVPGPEAKPPRADVQPDISAVRTGTHWLSTRMSSAPVSLLAPATPPEPVAPAEPEPEREPEAQYEPAEVPLVSSAITQDIIDQIEILRLSLARTKELMPREWGAATQFEHEPLPPAIAANAPDHAREQPLPPVADRPHHASQPNEDSRTRPARRPDSALGWSAAALGAVLLVAGIRHFGDEPAVQLPRAAPVAAFADMAPRTAPTIARADVSGSDQSGITPKAETDKPAAPPTPSAQPLMAEVEFQTAESAGPGLMVDTIPSADWEQPRPMHDAVENVLIRGLPPGVTLSAGSRISETDWQIASADADNVGLVVPGDQTDPVRAEIEFKTRDGDVLARLGLNVAHEPAPLPMAPPAPLLAAPALATPIPAALMAPEPVEAEQPAPPEIVAREEGAPQSQPEPAPVVDETEPETVQASEPQQIAVQEEAEATSEPAPMVEMQEQELDTDATPPAPPAKAKASRIKPKPMHLGVAKQKAPVRARPAPVVKTAAVAKMAAPPPRGLFQFGPGGVKVSTATPPQPAQPAPTPPKAPPAAAPSAAATPKQAALADPDRPPGFETLETLGGVYVPDRR
jgi:hypothetical protein